MHVSRDGGALGVHDTRLDRLTAQTSEPSGSSMQMDLCHGLR